MRLKFTYRQNKFQFISWLIATPIVFAICKWMLPQLPSSAMAFDGFWVNKVYEKAENDVVFIGDSRVYRGINPHVIDSILDIKSFNFGFSSSGLDTFMLNRGLEKLKPNGKKTIVFGLSVNQFLTWSLANGHYHSLLDLKPSDVFVRKYLYSHLKFADPYGMSDFYYLYKGEKYFETFYPDNGYVASNKLPMDSTAALEAYEKQFAKAEFGEENFKVLLHRIKELQKEGYRFYALRMPCTHAMWQLEDSRFIGQMKKLMSELESNKVRLLDVQGHFTSYDGSHLTAKSADILSGIIANKMR